MWKTDSDNSNNLTSAGWRSDAQDGDDGEGEKQQLVEADQLTDVQNAPTPLLSELKTTILSRNRNVKTIKINIKTFDKTTK